MFFSKPPKIDFKGGAKPISHKPETIGSKKGTSKGHERSIEELDGLSPEQLQNVDVTSTIEKLIEGSEFEKKLDDYF